MLLLVCRKEELICEGGLKSFRPSLCETRDKRPLDRESDISWCHHHTTSMIKQSSCKDWGSFLRGHGLLQRLYCVQNSINKSTRVV